MFHKFIVFDRCKPTCFECGLALTFREWDNHKDLCDYCVQENIALDNLSKEREQDENRK